MSNPDPCEKRPRQRVSVACLPCRQKRIRCDGALPFCGCCTAKGLSCEYNFTENKRKPPSKAYVQSLEARIRSLEEQLSLRDARPILHYTRDKQDASMEMRFDVNDDSGGRNMVSALTGLMGRLNIGDDGQLHYFGSQSNYHLINGNMGYDSIESTVSLQRQGLAAAECMGKNVPLSMELQEHLLELYWTWQHPWNYIIHKDAFLHAFKSRMYGRYCTPLLLSAIFAIASRFSDRTELRTVADDPNTAGYAFFEQAKILFLYESQAPIVATVQAAALMGMRALSDGQEALGWLYCGNAARMALNLGLNIDCSQWVVSGLISAEEAEVRKVTWWGCFVLDKYAPNSGLSAKDVEDIVARTDVELRSFYLSLPSHLRLPAVSHQPMPAHIYQLHMQYHVNLILLHRPLLEVSPGIPKSYPVLAAQERPHLKACRDSAMEVVKVLRTYKQHYKLRFASLATVHIAFTAALIHLLDTKLESGMCQQQATRSFTTCVDALEELKHTWSAWSAKALRAIHHLQEERSTEEYLETMAEVIGLVSSIITIVEVAGRLGSSTLNLKRLWDEVRNAPRSIRRHLDQLEILAPAIDEIRAEYQHPKASCGMIVPHTEAWIYQIRLQFPAWLLQKARDFQAHRACNGWTFQLKTWNIRPYDAEIFKFAEVGRLDLIFEALKRKEASIYDRTPSGATLILFAMQTGRLNVIKGLVQMGMRLTDENVVILLIRNWYLSTSDKSEVMELFDLFKSGEGFSPWLDYDPETDPDIMMGDGLYESIYLFAGSGSLSRLLFSPADMVKGLEFGHSWEWLDPELPLDLLTEGSITPRFFRQKPVYREEKFGYDLYEFLFHYFHMVLNGWDVEVEHWRALARGVFNGAAPREVAQPWNLSKRHLPLLCRTLRDIWKRQFPLGSFANWLAGALSMWLEDIANAGVDLEEYFLWEASTCRGDTELDPKIEVQRGTRIPGYGPSLVIVEHGKRPDDWLFEWDPCVEELVGEFWDVVETPNIPGAWVEDDENEIEDGLSHLTHLCRMGKPFGCIISSARYWSKCSATGGSARLVRVRGMERCEAFEHDFYYLSHGFWGRKAPLPLV
ncbi:hypothetical protein NM208_g3813 [Fusarium decemcellulare]|uniref:Uncharacterized protein n=1 Tax=Fusarium decemcellulare TaxID=57161 RepID=A0ACC1SN85_9HYPO|nr:hypothetical protein NM208_g3813 [Fusarium decemcellulare]